jgi:methyl-accepting chemotaxis protein
MSLTIRLPTPAFGLPRIGRVVRGAIAFPLTLMQAVEGVAQLPDVVRALDKIVLLESALDKLANLQDELENLGNLQDELAAIAGFRTILEELVDPVHQLAASTGSMPELAVSARSLPQLTEQVRGVQGIVERIDARIDEVAPSLVQIAAFGSTLNSEIEELGDALGPLSRIAARMPGSGKKKD